MRLLLCILVLTGTAHAQHGMNITGAHPRILFDATRLAAARAYMVAHPWTPGSNVIDHAADYAAYSQITGDRTYCDAARDTVLAFQIDTYFFMQSAGAATDHGDDPMRYYGEVVAIVLDHCQTSFSTAQKRLLMDRWMGATLNAADPVHTASNCSISAGSLILTCGTAVFLPNMADPVSGNMAQFQPGGTNCPTVDNRWKISSYTSATQVTLHAQNATGALPAALNAVNCVIRVGGYVDITRTNPWGGPAMPWSNYFWAFLRNEVLWGGAFYGESMYAPDFLDWAFDTRWPVVLAFKNGTGIYAANSSKGGIWNEGVEYGLQVFLYHPTFAIFCKRYGRDLLSETNWYKEAAAFTIYNTTLKKASDNNGGTFWQHFSWDDNQKAADDTTPGYPTGMLAQVPMRALGSMFGSTNLGKYVRQYVDTISGTGIAPNPWLPDPLGTTLSLSGLPLDYYAPGAGVLFTKNTWNGTGTQVKIMSAIDRTGHLQEYQGAFQIVRNGIWLARGLVAYTQTGNPDAIVVCPGYTSTTTCDGASSHAFNTIALGPAAPANCNTGTTIQDDTVDVKRLESKPHYTYMAVNLTPAYAPNPSPFEGGRACGNNNPYVEHVEREALFVRDTETLILVDRVQSGSHYVADDTHPVVTPSNVVKTVYVHSPVAPAISGTTATWDNQGQRMKLWAFGSDTPNLSDVNEGNFPGHNTVPPIGYFNHRLHISNASAVAGATAVPQNYFVTVLRMGDGAGWQDFTTATLTDHTTFFTLRLDHPSGNILWNIDKGAVSSGGTFGYSANGVPTASSLGSTVNTPGVTDTGISWSRVLIGTQSLPPGQQFTAYSAQLSAVGGQAPYNWRVTSGRLPFALTLSAGGVISGIPLEGGTAAFQVEVSDASGASETQDLNLAVTPLISTMTMTSALSPTTALLRLSKMIPGGGPFGSAPCEIQAFPEDGGAIVPVTDPGGAATRYVTLAGLTPARAYYFYAQCGPLRSWDRLVTPSAGDGTLVPLFFSGHAGLNDAVAMVIEFGPAPSPLNQSAFAACVPECRVQVNVPAGDVVYFRRKWLGAGGSTLRTDEVSAVIAPAH